MNINISDIRDAANYIVNPGKEAESKGTERAQANIEEQEKLGAIKIANQIKERETKVAKPAKIGYRHRQKPRNNRKSPFQMRIRTESLGSHCQRGKESQVSKGEAEKNIASSRQTPKRKSVSPNWTPTWKSNRQKLQKAAIRTKWRTVRKWPYQMLYNTSQMPNKTSRWSRRKIGSCRTNCPGNRPKKREAKAKKVESILRWKDRSSRDRKKDLSRGKCHRRKAREAEASQKRLWHKQKQSKSDQLETR